MINQPKDLDQSSVEDDADEMREQTIADLTGDLDPADLYGVCALICDALYSGDPEEFAQSQVLRDLVETTQSNPEGVIEKIAEALWVDFG